MSHPFEKQLENAGLINPSTPRPPNSNGVTVDINPENKTAYAVAALQDECAQVANAAPKTRNHTLNRAAFNLASLVQAGHLDRHEVEQALTTAANIASLAGDHPLTDEEIRNTIASGFNGSSVKVGARDIPEQPVLVDEVNATYFTSRSDHQDEGVGGDDTDDDDKTDPIWGHHPPQDGAAFLFDQPDTVTALWGDGDDILWAEGEAFMICGGMGLGKTTLAGQIIYAQLLGGVVLNLPVTPTTGTILYLAMDRPRQIRRSFLRQFDPTERDQISGRLLIRPGPPIADIAKYPGLLAAMARKADAAIVYVDSLKDAAIGLSSDEVGAAYNRARQELLAAGIQLCELHHNRKTTIGNTPGSVTEVYGSTWIAAGAGSIVNLVGEPGDPIIGFRHVKQPLNEVGPWRLRNDMDKGRITIDHQVDLIQLARYALPDGLTAVGAAAALFDVEKPTKSQVEKARYRLDKLVNATLLVRVDGSRGGSAAVWMPVDE